MDDLEFRRRILSDPKQKDEEILQALAESDANSKFADDVLDLQGDVSVIGKNIGDDLSEGKMTLPMIYAREHSSPEHKDILRDAISNKSSKDFDQILKIVSESGGLDYSLKSAKEHSDLAIKSLEGLPESQYKKVLTELATFAVLRNT